MTAPRPVVLAIGIFLLSAIAFYSPRFLSPSVDEDLPRNVPISQQTIRVVDSRGVAHVGRTLGSQHSASSAPRKKRSLDDSPLPRGVVNTSDPLLTNPNRRVYKGAKGHYWLGVPYAKEFRTASSLNEHAEKDTAPPPRRTLEYGKVCPQPVHYLRDGSIYPAPSADDASNNETLYGMMGVDCLSVNIITPVFVTDPPTEVFHRVLVFFAGGPYRLNGGSSRRYGLHGPMSNLVTPGSVVVVVVQSRLGPLGYYRPPDAESDWCPPALMDLLLAMKWVRENIAAFGGDAQHITLMGEGGGACGASMLALAAIQPRLAASGLSELFQRVILHGGGADTCISGTGDGESNSRRLERRLCASFTTPEEIKQCMEGKTWRELIEASEADNLQWGYELDDNSSGIFRLPEVMFSNALDTSLGPDEFYHLLHRDEWARDSKVAMERIGSKSEVNYGGYSMEFAEKLLAKVLGGMNDTTRGIIDATLRLYDFHSLESYFAHAEDGYLRTMEMMGDALYTTAVLRNVQRAGYARKNHLVWFTHPSVHAPKEAFGRAYSPGNCFPDQDCSGRVSFSATPAETFEHYALLPDHIWSRPAIENLTDAQLAKELSVAKSAADFIHSVVHIGSLRFGDQYVSAARPTAYQTMAGKDAVEMCRSGFIRPDLGLEEHWGVFRGHLPAGARLTPAYVLDKVTMMSDSEE